MVIQSLPTFLRYMWVPRVTLIPMVLVDIMLRSRYLMKSTSDLTKINYSNMEYSNTIGFRVTTGDHMYIGAVGRGHKTMLRLKMPNPHLQKHMFFPRMTLILTVLEDIRLWWRYLIKSKEIFRTS